ncbi:hypothetical protein KB1_18430 [Cutibacterium modestum]|uniref:Uncharacterized protein n=1 Tax=Cutibacterium modestum TaxID=2559073 RepID=A0AAD1NWB6_9ACTN|nr:hypothetical protein KB1_18430 [Cutibacterium modestum]
MKSVTTEAILMIRIKGASLFLSLIPISLRVSPAKGNTANESGSGHIATFALLKDI